MLGLRLGLGLGGGGPRALLRSAVELAEGGGARGQLRKEAMSRV